MNLVFITFLSLSLFWFMCKCIEKRHLSRKSFRHVLQSPPLMTTWWNMAVLRESQIWEVQFNEPSSVILSFLLLFSSSTFVFRLEKVEKKWYNKLDRVNRTIAGAFLLFSRVTSSQQRRDIRHPITENLVTSYSPSTNHVTLRKFSISLTFSRHSFACKLRNKQVGREIGNLHKPIFSLKPSCSQTDTNYSHAT